MSCPECEALRRELAIIKGEMEVPRSVEPLDLIRRAYDLDPGAARVILALFQTPDVLSSWDLVKAASRKPEMINGDGLTKVRVCRARQAMSHPKAIETVWGHGYRMTADGRAEVYAVLNGAPKPKRSAPAAQPDMAPRPAAERPKPSTPRRFSWENA